MRNRGGKEDDDDDVTNEFVKNAFVLYYMSCAFGRIMKKNYS